MLQSYTYPFKITKTNLTILRIHFFSKRFYPGNPKLPTLSDLIRFRYILDITAQEKALIPPSHALVRYNSIRLDLYKTYCNYLDPLLIAQLHQHYKNVRCVSNERINFNDFKTSVSPSIQAIIDYRNQLQSQKPDQERLMEFIEKSFTDKNTINYQLLEDFKSQLDLVQRPLSEKEQLFLKNLENYLLSQKNKWINNNSQQELSSRNIENMTIADLLEMKPLSRCFTIEDYNLQRLFYEKVKKLVKDHKHDLSDQQIIDVLTHAKILKYGHVFWREDTYDVDSLFFGLTQQVKNAEGPKLLQKAYELISTNNDKITFLKKRASLTPTQFQQFINKLDNKEFFMGILKRDLSSDTLLLSSQDLHLLCVVEDPLDPEYYLVCGMFTSAKDNGTIKLSNTQEINDNPDEENKEQRFRPSTKFMRIKKSEFQEHADATTFAKGVNKQGENVHQIIIDAIKSKLSLLQSNDIQEPVTFTREALIDLAILAFQQLASDHEAEKLKIKDKLNSRDKVKQAEFKNNRIFQKINEIKKQEERDYFNFLSEIHKSLYDIMKLLQKRKSLQHETPNKDTPTSKIDQQQISKIELLKESNVIQTNNTNQHE